jgi:Asp-tRNA(Asn)/Glu-tRNA(Gln) amidotransferase A subunit family amidase
METASFAKIAARDTYYKAFLYLEPRASEEPREVGTLTGMRLAIKDNISVRDMPLTFGSRLFADNIAKRDAEVVKRLRGSGAVIVGKTNLDEFASGVWGVSGLGGQTRHAFSPDLSPGGSSAGSAVAVATGMVDGAIGTDTCTSILMPAAQAGVVGMRPSHGLVPLDGVLPGYPRQDVVGPVAKTVTDAARLLSVISARDELLIAAPRETLTLLVPPNRASLVRDPLVNAAFEKMITRLKAAGATILRTNESFSSYIDRAEETQLDSEAMDAFVDYLAGLPGSPVTSRIDFASDRTLDLVLGGVKGPRDYLAQIAVAPADSPERIAQHVAARLALERAIARELASYGADAILLPTMEGPPAPIDSQDEADIPDDHCSLPAFSGMPAISLPAGYLGRTRLPFGIMLLTHRDHDGKLLRIARQIEGMVSGR